MKLELMGKAWECSRRGSALFELQREREVIKVVPSPSGDGSWFCLKRFLAVTFHVDAQGNLAVGKPPKVDTP